MRPSPGLHLVFIRPVVLAGLAGAAALSTGCAAQSAGSPLRGPDDGRQTIVLTTQAGTAEATIRRDQHIAVADLPFTRADVWPYLLESWTDAGLPAPVVDRSGYIMSITNQTVHRRLGRRSLSTFLSCGSSISGPNADTHRIRLTVQALLDRLGESASSLHIRIGAMAYTTEGASSTPLPCASLGTLENTIINGVIERLRAGAD